MAEKAGCQYAVVVASSDYTKKIAKNLDMTLMKITEWSKYKDPKDGSNYYPDTIKSTNLSSYFKHL